MLKYFVSKLFLMIPVVFIVSLVVFTIMHLIPGDAAYVMLGEEATPEAVASLRKELGLDQNLMIQYFRWAGNALQGDLGRSIVSGSKVLDSILERLPVTLFLALSSIFLSIVVALPVGIIAGIKPKTSLDIAATTLAMAGIAVPNFLLGILLIYFFGLQLDWLPIMGYVSLSENVWEAIQHIFLPAVALGAALTATNTRFIRSSMLEVMNKEYITTARSKGLTESATIRVHALKNALSPVMTVLGLQLGRVFGGAMIVETVFAIPGLGRLVVNAVFERDFPMVQGVVLFMALGVLIVNLIVDMLYAVLDPRIEY